jgi:hypothetical protein
MRETLKEYLFFSAFRSDLNTSCQNWSIQHRGWQATPENWDFLDVLLWIRNSVRPPVFHLENARYQFSLLAPYIYLLAASYTLIDCMNTPEHFVPLGPVIAAESRPEDIASELLLDR